MIRVDCRCGHAEVVHDGPCTMPRCSCVWYRRRRPRMVWRELRPLAGVAAALIALCIGIARGAR